VPGTERWKLATGRTATVTAGGRMFRYSIKTNDGRRLYVNARSIDEALALLHLAPSEVKRTMPIKLVVPEEELEAIKATRLANLKAGRKKIAEERKLAKKIEERRKKNEV
jgi:hypothetical protein